MAKMKLEVVIETDGEYCGQLCPLGVSPEWCQTGHLDYDWQNRVYRRSNNCKSKAVECPE